MKPGVLHPIVIGHRRKGRARLAREYPAARIVDVTSQAEEPWRRLSPMFPHGGIPVPGWPGRVSATVEGIWQGLKRFEHDDIDVSLFEWPGRGAVKRTSRGRGRDGSIRGQVVGHQFGADPSTLLNYLEARRRIYLPAYYWMLDVRARDQVEQLRAIVCEHDVVLLDYATNDSITDPSRPLSHAALIRAYLLDEWPRETSSVGSRASTKERRDPVLNPPIDRRSDE
jgi:hypothetical protein